MMAPVHMPSEDGDVLCGAFQYCGQRRCIVQSDLVHETDLSAQWRVMKSDYDRTRTSIRQFARKIFNALGAQLATTPSLDQRIEANDKGVTNVS